jgi:hypothetical protein
MDRKTMRFSNIQSKVVLGLLAATCLAVAAPARADDSRDEGEHDNRRDRDRSKTHIAVDFDFNTAVDARDTSTGGGGALRLGQELDLFLVSLTPELGGGYHAFGSGDDRNKLYSGFLGGRLAFGKIIEPSLFGHVGVGRLDGPEARTAAVLDGGLAIDFTLLPLIDLGLHGAYNVMLPRDDGTSFKFVTLGAQAALVL